MNTSVNRFRVAGVLAALTLWLTADAVHAANLTIDGRVVDADGEGLRGARVTLAGLESRYQAATRRLAAEVEPVLAQTVSGADGSFELAAPGPGMWWISIALEGRIPMRMSWLPMLESVVLPDAVLEVGEELAVRVTDPEGRPLAARLAARSRGPMFLPVGFQSDETFAGRWQADVRTAITRDDGRAAFRRRPSEKLLIAAVAGEAVVEIETGDGHLAEIVVGDESWELKVTDDRGRPFPSLAVVTVGVGEPLAITDDRGRASLIAAPGAEVEVSVFGPKGETWNETIRIPERPRREGTAMRDADREIVLRLDEPVMAMGRVFDARDRRPIAGAWVWSAGNAGGFVDSDAGGGFSVATSGDPHSVLFAAAPGYCRGLAQAVVVGESSAAVALVPAAMAAGVVVDPGGKPIADVSVSASLEGSPSRAARAAAVGGWHSRTGDDGRFRLTGLPAGESFLFEFSRSGYARAELDVAELVNPNDLRVVLDVGLRGLGTLVNEDGEPIAGGEVRLREASDLPMGLLPEVLISEADRQEGQVTDAAGRFVIADLSPGRYDLEATARGFAPLTVPGVEVTADGAAADPGNVDLGTLVMVPGVGLDGLVVDREGQVISGAAVYVNSPDVSRQLLAFLQGDQVADATSDAGGRFRVVDLRSGDILILMVRKPGYATKMLNSVKVSDPQGAPLEVVLEEVGRMSGRVIDTDGSPVAGARVSFEFPVGTDADGAFRFGDRDVAISGDDGSFELDSLAAGDVAIRVTATGFQKYELSGLHVPAGGEIEDVEVVLEPGVELAGRVVSPDGEPLADAWVRVLELDDSSEVHGFAGTDAEGRFHIDGLAPGRRSVAAHRDGFVPVAEEVELQAGGHRIELQLRGGVEVSGRVVDMAGQPLDDVVVGLRRSPPSSGVPEAISRPDGTFRFDNVEPGDYKVRATKDGYYVSPETEPLTVESSPIVGVEVQLAAGTILRGRILGLELDDLARVEVLARHADGESHRGQVRHDGYEISGLRPGEWSVRASIRQSGKRTDETVEIVDGMPHTELDLEFRPGLEVTGFVAHRGEAVRGAQVWLHRKGSAGSSSVATGGDGAFRFEHLRRGDYRLFARGHAGTIEYHEDLEIDRNREIFIELESAAEIAGFVRDAMDQEPLAGVEIELESRQPDGELEKRDSARTDSRGYFRLRSVPEGPWRLTASTSGYAPGRRTGEIRAGEIVSDLELELRQVEGISFQVFHTDGTPATRVRAAVIDGAGQRVTGNNYPATAGGRVRMTTVPEGSWQLLVQASGSATAVQQVVAPGSAGRIDLVAASSLTVRVPSLDAETEAHLALVGTDGRMYRSVSWGGRVQAQWPLRLGRAVVSDLHPGDWTVVVTAADGRQWTDSVAVVVGEKLEVVLD